MRDVSLHSLAPEITTCPADRPLGFISFGSRDEVWTFSHGEGPARIQRVLRQLVGDYGGNKDERGIHGGSAGDDVAYLL